MQKQKIKNDLGDVLRWADAIDDEFNAKVMQSYKIDCVRPFRCNMDDE